MAKKIKSTDQIGQLVKRSDFWIGVVTVLVLGTLFTGAFRQKTGNNPMAAKTGVSPTSNTVKPATESAVSVNLNTRVATAAARPETKLAKVKKLADTSGVYTVKNGDNYFTISEKVCGTGVYFLSIQSQNESKALQPGDIVSANCVE